MRHMLSLKMNRRKGIRTLSLWFWRPLFYRWNYSPFEMPHTYHCLVKAAALRCLEHETKTHFLQPFFVRPFRLVVRTSLFHGEETGSIPVGDTMASTKRYVEVASTRRRIVSFVSKVASIKRHVEGASIKRHVEVSCI